MSNIVDLRNAAVETNSRLWTVSVLENEPVLQVTGHRPTIDPAGSTVYLPEEPESQVALIGDVKRNYRMRAEMRFLRCYLERGGWFGFALRAQDVLNYEIIWFMPTAETGDTAAYVPVAHGVVPWWTEAYANQKKGNPHIPTHAWFGARVEVSGDEFTLYLEDKFVFTKKMTYYLATGRPGFFVGTATDAAFRRVVIEDLP